MTGVSTVCVVVRVCKMGHVQGTERAMSKLRVLAWTAGVAQNANSLCVSPSACMEASAPLQAHVSVRHHGQVSVVASQYAIARAQLTVHARLMVNVHSRSRIQHLARAIPSVYVIMDGAMLRVALHCARLAPALGLDAQGTVSA